MKRFMGWVAVGLALGALVLALNLNACAGEKGFSKGKKDGTRKEAPRGGEMDGSGDFNGPGMIERMKSKLDLSDEQVQKLKALVGTARKDGKPLREKLSEDVKVLARKLKDGARDSELTALLDKVQADHKALQAHRERQMEAVRKILSPTQQAKMVVRMSGRMARGGKKDGKWGKDFRWSHGDQGKGDPKESPKDDDANRDGASGK
jgi:Spy/CpxP family protein refolding chaperone